MNGRNIAIAAIAIFAVLAVGWLALIHRIDPIGAASVAAAGPSVSGGGVTLVSDSITLPEEAAALPATPGSDLIAAHCTACHSVEMILNQPQLNAEKWQATIEKMRGIYKAPIAPVDDKALATALMALPNQATPK
jgi:cytochrome c5